jgi:hypothetical protein
MKLSDKTNLIMSNESCLTRRSFLGRAASAAWVAPLIVNSKVFGANDRITMGCIGMGGQGRGDMGGFLSFQDLKVLAVCDVVAEHRNEAKASVDGRYGNTDCKAYVHFGDILTRSDIDTVLIGTPDHWHAIIGIEAMKQGKDVYCEKPETLTVRQGRVMTEVARRYGRVFSGGSQRVWGDYQWFHQMVRGGAIGEVREAWVNVGGPSGPCYLPPVPIPEGVDWNLWLGPAPWRPFHPTLIRGGFRAYRDYSGGGMTDWGCHGFGGALFTCNLHETGPVEVIPPDGKDHPQLTYVCGSTTGAGGVACSPSEARKERFRRAARKRLTGSGRPTSTSQITGVAGAFLGISCTASAAANGRFATSRLHTARPVIVIWVTSLTG